MTITLMTILEPIFVELLKLFDHVKSLKKTTKTLMSD